MGDKTAFKHFEISKCLGNLCGFLGGITKTKSNRELPGTMAQQEVYERFKSWILSPCGVKVPRLYCSQT